MQVFNLEKLVNGILQCSAAAATPALSKRNPVSNNTIYLEFMKKNHKTRLGI